MTMLGVRRFGLSRSSRLLKRAFDTLSRPSAVVVSPVLCSRSPWRSGSSPPGPSCSGRSGSVARRALQIFKFRSMVIDAESSRMSLRALNEAGDGLFKITHDPRVTRVGTLPAAYLAGRAAAAVQRAARRDEPRGAATAGRRRGRSGARPGPQPPASTPGMTGPWQILGLAGADAGDGRDRLSLCGQLVALARPEGPPAHRASRAPGANV